MGDFFESSSMFGQELEGSRDEGALGGEFRHCGEGRKDDFYSLLLF